MMWCAIIGSIIAFFALIGWIVEQGERPTYTPPVPSSPQAPPETPKAQAPPAPQPEPITYTHFEPLVSALVHFGYPRKVSRQIAAELVTERPDAPLPELVMLALRKVRS